jgi:hypothetical protein
MKRIGLVVVLLILGISNSLGQIKSDSLVYYFPLDGNVITDASGNNHNGTANNTQAILDRVGLQPSSAISLNGTSSYIQLPNDPELKPSFPFSLVFWIKVANFPSVTQSIYRADDDITAYAGFSIQLTNSGKINSSVGSGNGIGSQHRRTYQSNAQLIVNQWHHVVVNYLGVSSVEIFIDGTKATGSFSGTASSMGYSSVAGVIGRNPVSSGGYNYLQVELDELRLYNDEIDDSEVGFFAFEYPCIVKVEDTTAVYDTIVNTIQVTDTIPVNDTVYTYNIITYYDSVAVSDTLVVNSPNGTPSNQQYSISVYPNPNKDRLYIEFGSNFLNLSGKSIRIVNAFGVIVYTKLISNPFEYVDFLTMGGKGTYFLQMTQGANNVLLTRRIVIQ